MKKILSLLGAITLTASASTVVVSCGTSDYSSNINNPNFNGGIKNETENDQNQIKEAGLARAKSLILQDQFKLSDESTKDKILTNNSQYDGSTGAETLEKHYKENFNESSINKAKKTNLSTDGTYGKDGEILDKLIGSIGIPDDVMNILNKLLGTNDLMGQLTGMLQSLPSILQTLNIATIVAGIPVGLGMIPDIGLPDLIMDLLSKVVDGILGKLTGGQEQIDKVLDGIAKGSDLSRFSNLTIKELDSVMYINLGNILGAGFNENFTPLAEDVKDLTSESSNFVQSAYLLADNISNISNFKLQNIDILIYNLFSFLNILNLKMTIFSTKEAKMTDDQHIFSDTQTNNAYVAAKMKSKVSDIKTIDISKFNLGALISNVRYYLGDENDYTAQRKMQKLMYIMLFDGTVPGFLSFLKNAPPFWNFILNFAYRLLGNSNADPTLTNVIKIAYGPLAKFVVSEIVNNQPLQLTKLLSDKTFGPLIKDKLPNAEELLTSIQDAFTTEPLTFIYEGDLTNVLNSLKTIIGEEQIEGILKTIRSIMGDKKLNVKNILNLKLSSILKLANVEGYKQTDLEANNGLMPNYADYYTSMSIKQLIQELGKTFDITGNETNEELQYRYFDFQYLKTMIDKLLFDNGNKQSLLAEIVANINHPEKLYPLIGYADGSKSDVKVDSFLGQLLLFFVPELALDENINKADATGVINSDKDLGSDKTDNFQWIMYGASMFLGNILKGTDYSDWINAVAMDQGAFNVNTDKTKESYFSNGNLKGVIMYVTFNPDGIDVGNNIKLTGKPIQYKIYYTRDNPSDSFEYKEISKIL